MKVDLPFKKIITLHTQIFGLYMCVLPNLDTKDVNDNGKMY